MVPRGAVVLGLVAVLGLSACAEPDSGQESTTSASTVAPSTTTTSTTTTSTTIPPTTTQPSDGAPADLAGTWRIDLGGGDIVLLTLDGITYRIRRGPNSGSGRISVDGDQIEFSGSSLCSGTGSYTWVRQGDELTFTSIGTDPCGGRSGPLLGGNWTFVQP